MNSGLSEFYVFYIIISHCLGSSDFMKRSVNISDVFYIFMCKIIYTICMEIIWHQPRSIKIFSLWYVCVSECVSKCMSVCLSVCVSVCISVYLIWHIYIYVYIYILKVRNIIDSWDTWKWQVCLQETTTCNIISLPSIWLTNWLTEQPTDQLTDPTTDQLTDQTTNWPTNRLTKRLTNWLTKQLIDWLTKQPTKWLTDWPTDRLTDQPTD